MGGDRNGNAGSIEADRGRSDDGDKRCVAVLLLVAKRPGTTALGAKPPHSGVSSRSERREIRSPPMSATAPPIRVNRAPVLTLWATVVAERLGYSAEAAHTLGGIVFGIGG
jgi:hypothetical protein